MRKLIASEMFEVSGAGDSDVKISFEGFKDSASAAAANISSSAALGDFSKLTEGVDLVEVQIEYVS